MIGVEWFELRGWWHALRGDSAVKAECGITMSQPPSVTASTEEDPWPPVPCMGCATRAAERFMIEEPLEDALARGFAPVDRSEVE